MNYHLILLNRVFVVVQLKTIVKIEYQSDVMIYIIRYSILNISFLNSLRLSYSCKNCSQKFSSFILFQQWWWWWFLWCWWNDGVRQKIFYNGNFNTIFMLTYLWLEDNYCRLFCLNVDIWKRKKSNPQISHKIFICYVSFCITSKWKKNAN
jgi:hypothetical protein